ncbi:hypothetical protein PJF56_12855 [Roseofilum sp. BLCC_M91]|uniref:Uncharacterized protein n=1 Tax=Roseofilum halophilum BLCC-M91 TaxID=3022259 RepID=A0ABT7BKP6_9CYAN|nr:hypothetical protein [Roseofilum halophilum]MDJ1179755.1 hypothetical protein [Roseofilum halophilum BLCC-M91]
MTETVVLSGLSFAITDYPSAHYQRYALSLNLLKINRPNHCEYSE